MRTDRDNSMSVCHLRAERTAGQRVSMSPSRTMNNNNMVSTSKASYHVALLLQDRVIVVAVDRVAIMVFARTSHQTRLVVETTEKEKWLPCWARFQTPSFAAH